MKASLKYIGITFCFILASCGIYTFTGADIHPDIETISISYFNNQATLVQPMLSSKFTEALQDRFIQQTSLELTSKEGDLQFEGYISDYQIKPMSITANDQASQNRLSITVQVSFTNLTEKDKSFKQNFSRYADFDSSTEISSIEELLIDEIVAELIEDIFNKAVVNW